VPSTEPSITVLVVDDQVLIRAGLVALLRAAPGIEVVGEAADGAAAVALAAETRPQVIIMDIRMPGVDGIAATRQILAAAPEADRPRVLVLTTFDLDEYVYEALRAGASGFVLKDSPPERLINAVATVAGGDLLFAPRRTRPARPRNRPWWRIRPRSPAGRSRCCAWWLAAGPTPRSPSIWSSPRRR